MKLAAAGAAVWIVLAGAFCAGLLPFGPLELLFALAPLVIVPLGWEVAAAGGETLAEGGLRRMAVAAHPPAAVLAVVSFWLPAGLLAGGLVLPWAAVAGLTGLWGAVRLRDRGLVAIEDACASAGMMMLAFGAAWLFFSRFGWAPMGFVEPIVLLTAVHFHYTAFAVPILTAAAGKALGGKGPRWLFLATAAGAVAGPPLLAAGWTFSPALQLFGVLVVSASALGLSILQLRLAFRPACARRRALWALSSLAAWVSMPMAIAYGIGSFVGEFWLAIPAMVAVHGTLNALGFVLCGLLAWTMGE